ncbi:MAG: inosine/xanthosine triphosphatase [Candidatus Hodarchaeales archaeon]
MKVLVASKNPVKIKATEEMFNKIFNGEEHEFFAVKVDSGVNHTPSSDGEMITGAINRAKAALNKKTEFDYSVGIEGGLSTIDGIGTFLKAWVAVINSTGVTGIGQTPAIRLPQKFIEQLDGNIELADVAANISRVADIRSKEGVFGFLTSQWITRKTAFHSALINALAPFYNSQAYT